MTRRKGRTLSKVYEQHDQNARQRRDYLKELQREVQRKDQEKVQEAAQQIIDEYRERRPSPPQGGVQEHTPVAPDSRLGFLRNNPQALPLVPLAPPRDLGDPPQDGTFRGGNPATARPDDAGKGE